MQSTEYSEIKHQYVKNEYRSSLLCIDSYENKTLAGRIYNPYLGDGRSFINVMQFLGIAEDLFDMMDYPQNFTATRKFWTNPLNAHNLSADKNAITSPPQGKMANFLLKVIFRQNASWQGSLSWLDQNREESFRSVLELLKLLDEALSTPVEALND